MNLFENLQLMKESIYYKSIDEMKNIILLFHKYNDAEFIENYVLSHGVSPNSSTILDGLSEVHIKELYYKLINRINTVYGPDYSELNSKIIKELNLDESLNTCNENYDMDSIKNYWVYKEIIENDYQIEITDNSLTIRFPKPDNDIYAHYTFRYDEDFEDWLVYFHGDKPERKGELIIDDLESISSYESVVKGCLYNFWNTH